MRSQWGRYNLPRLYDKGWGCKSLKLTCCIFIPISSWSFSISSCSLLFSASAESWDKLEKRIQQKGQNFRQIELNCKENICYLCSLQAFVILSTSSQPCSWNILEGPAKYRLEPSALQSCWQAFGLQWVLVRCATKFQSYPFHPFPRFAILLLQCRNWIHRICFLHRAGIK